MDRRGSSHGRTGKEPYLRFETDGDQEVAIDFLGFTIPDAWMVGYDLDHAERYRSLLYIDELPPEIRER